MQKNHAEEIILSAIRSVAEKMILAAKTAQKENGIDNLSY